MHAAADAIQGHLEAKDAKLKEKTSDYRGSKANYNLFKAIKSDPHHEFVRGSQLAAIKDVLYNQHPSTESIAMVRKIALDRASTLFPFASQLAL